MKYLCSSNNFGWISSGTTTPVAMKAGRTAKHVQLHNDSTHCTTSRADLAPNCAFYDKKHETWYMVYIHHEGHFKKWSHL